MLETANIIPIFKLETLAHNPSSPPSEKPAENLGLKEIRDMSEISNETSGGRTLTNNVNDCGSNPSELYGTFTWKIEKFSQINDREIRSNVFEVGGHRWFMLIYPQGCDVSNNLSLFLCVANYDKLLPGWSHLAQFTLSLENKNPNKSKFSADTIHQFWKKEHDWGWKKFIELPKLQDGYIDKFDSLVFKAQVQVIRECVNRPFRCLDGQYKKEILRVYSKNVEEIFLNFVKEKRSKLVKLIDDKKRWNSLCAFWLGMDQNLSLKMSREKMDVILKLVVKHFFIKKEVTSTLVMDFLFYGLKSLEKKSRILENLSQLFVKELVVNKKALKTLEDEVMNERTSIASVGKDMFDVEDPMLLLERFVLAPLPEFGSPNLVQVGNAGTRHNKALDEKQLTDFGRWVLEVFVLDHIFCNKIEFAYKEAITLERGEELIHEEQRENSKKCSIGQKKK